MSSEIKLIYKNKVTLEKMNVRRVCCGEYVNADNGNKLSSYDLKKNWMFLKGESMQVNPTFVRGKKTPSISPEHLKGFSLKKSSTHKVCDTGHGPTWKKTWEVYFGTEFVQGDFPTRNVALAFITEKTLT